MIDIRTNTAGRLTVSVGRFSLHLLPSAAEDRFWGYRRDFCGVEWFDSVSLHDFGVGPLAMLCWWRLEA